MHPDLAALQARYTELSQAANLNHISVEDATATLEALSVTDATGAVWRIDPYGQFTRADFPGAPAEHADIDRFVDAYAAPNPADMVADPNTFTGAPSANPFAAPQHPANDPNTFGGPHPGGFGHPAPGGFGTPDATGTPAPGAGGFQGTGRDPFADQTSGELYRPANERAARSLANAGQPSPFAARLAAAKDFVMHNLIVVVAVAVVIGLLVAHFAGGPDGEEIPTGTVPTAEPTTDPTDDPAPPAPTPDPTDPPTVPEPDPTLAAAPSPGDVSRVRKALVSGNRAAAAKLIATVDPQVLAVSAAMFAGVDEAGLKLRTGGVDQVDGEVVGTWTITGPDVEEISLDVVWVLDDGRWKLATPPVP